MAFKRNRVRLKLDLTRPLDPAYDVFQKGDLPLVARGRAVRVEVALFNGTTLDPLTEITSIKLEVKALNATGFIDAASAALMSKTVSAASFNLGLTQAQWDNGGDDDAHAVFEFLDTETGLTVLSTTNRTDYGYAITAQTSAGPTTIASGKMRFIQDGGLTVSTPPAIGDPSFVRVDDFLAAMQTVVKLGVNARGASFLLVNDLGYAIQVRAEPQTTAPEMEVIKLTNPV